MSLMYCCLTRLIEDTVRKETAVPRYGIRRYGTLQKLNSRTVCWYGTVKGARYVVRKF